MPVATSPSVACPSSVVKMEDRKRSAIGLDELAPPSKRQHLNGGGKSKDKDDGLDPKDEAWIEDYQKDAIYRQMLEYKREKTTLEARLEKVERRSASHQDHVKRNDGWIIQLLQELELLADSTLSLHSTSEAFSYPALPQLEDGQLERQLEDRSRKVKTRVEELLERIAATRASVSPEVSDLEKQLKSLLNKEKDFVVQIQHLNSEKDNLSEQLDAATLRYIKAEKKLDRAKSAQVQKLEQQAIATATSRPSNVENGVDPSEQNGRNEALESQFREASAVLAKQKEQLESAFAEIKGLQEENSTFKARRESLSEEDYARTDVFKLFKGQNEDLIKRINHLEATNKQLREEAEKLQAERTAFRTKLEEETLKDTMDLEDAVQVKESDLTRIRSARDELLADNAIKKASQEQERAAHEHIKELSSAKDDRIQALESELGRLRPQEDAAMSTPREDLEALSVSDLRERFIKLEKDYASIQSELPSMEKAYKKAIGLAQKKVWDYAGLEERVSVLAMEKSKADQKYFAARKDADIRNLEIRSLRHQNGKSSEIIASLKEVETQNRSLVSNLEKQVVTYKQSNTALMEENKTMKSTASDAVRRADGSKAQISDLINLVKSKDATNAAVKEQAAAHETETERLRTRLDHVQKDRDEWKSKCYSNSSAEEEMLRNLALCTVCRNNFKNTAIKACGHLFCHDCVEARLSNRMRKCPTCSKGFDKSDVMTVHM